MPSQLSSTPLQISFFEHPSAPSALDPSPRAGVAASRTSEPASLLGVVGPASGWKPFGETLERGAPAAECSPEETLAYQEQKRGRRVPPHVAVGDFVALHKLPGTRKVPQQSGVHQEERTMCDVVE